jgi:Flp pilus assembly protein TadG
MRRDERGSISVLSLMVVVPLLLLFLFIAVELQQFFGIREDLQRIVDDEARLASSRVISGEEVTARLRRRLASRAAYVAIESVRHASSAGTVELAMTGVYRGVFSHVLTAMMRSADISIPVSVYTKARRPRTSVLVAFDRTIGEGIATCGDERLRERAQFAERLIDDLKASGVSDVHVGVFPGVDRSFEIVAEERIDSLVRCDERRTDGAFDLVSLPGLTGVLGSAIDVAYDVVEAFVSGVRAEAEAPALVFVTRNNSYAVENITTTMGFLIQRAESFSVKVKVVALLQNGDESVQSRIWRGGDGGVEARLVPVDLLESNVSRISAVVVRHIYGQIVLAE